MLAFNSEGIVDDGERFTLSFKDFSTFFIENNIDKKRRKDLIKNLLCIFSSFYFKPISSVIDKIWIDGSFTKRVGHPNDLDVVFLCLPTPNNEKTVMKQMERITDNRDSILKDTGIHALIAIDYPQITLSKYSPSLQQNKNELNELYLYFYQLFTTDRNNDHKTLIQLIVEEGVIK